MRALDPRLTRRARPVRVLLVVDGLLGIAIALLVLGQAVLLARVASRSFDGATLGELSWPLAGLVAVVVARAAGAWGFEVVGRRAADDVIAGLRLDVVDARLRGDPRALDGTQSGEVATAAVSGVDALETTFARYVPQLALAVVVPVAVLALVASIDLLAAGLMLVTLPLVPVFMWLVGRYTEHRARERYGALALLSNHFLDVVRGLPTLRAFNRAEAQVEQIGRVGEEYRRTTMSTLRIAFLSGSILELAATLGIALVAVVVGVRLAEGGIGFEAALTVLVLAPELYLPLRNLAAQWHTSADGAAVAARLLDLVDESESACDDQSQAQIGRPQSTEWSGIWPVRFEQVSFRYPSRADDALRDVDLELRAGETVALVGASGGGKSTLLSLLLRFVEPTSGRIVVGDEDLGGIDPRAWRRVLAYVPQRPTVFRGTVADNIRLGDPDASPARVRAAAELAAADAFVGRLPQGYETLVGEGGRALSAGQARRIALARAFLRDAPLVLLDEPTADLDRTNAGAVADAFDRLRVGRTVVVVAHGPELAARADRVVRLESGRLVDAVPAR